MPINQNSLEAVMAFAQKFVEYSTDFQKQVGATRKSMEEVGKVWKDTQYGNFKKSVDKHIEEIYSTYAMLKGYTDNFFPGLIDTLKKYGEYDLHF